MQNEWFGLNDEQLWLYKKLYFIISELNNAWYKSFSGNYADDLIVFVSLLAFMNHFKNSNEIRQSKLQNEYFNSFVCDNLSERFQLMKNKLPVDFLKDNNEEYFFNQRGAKVWKDIRRQPHLQITEIPKVYNVLSVGLSKEMCPLLTVEEDGAIYCYRLSNDLFEWTQTVVGMANMGKNLFPSQVKFVNIGGKSYADIL